ncbi:hypothetical protein A33M_2914 [Rhodovulum sp. PH10]|nr:hypothetical protein A33M_2914 [Rhodovulum sp. PH10]
MPRGRPMKVPTSPVARSRLANGATVLDGVDGRSAAARRYRDLIGEMRRDVGGDPSAAQEAIIRRAATLVVWCEQAEAAFAQGEALDIAAFTTAANALRRLLADLGLERRAKDVTPSIAQYLAARRDVPQEAAE